MEDRLPMEPLPLAELVVMWYLQALPEHAQRVASLATLVATRLQSNAGEISKITLAALLHDIGKVLLPTKLLQKVDPLSADEWRLIQRHPEIGFRLLLNAGGCYAEVAPLVLAHHERWDGQGYPYGLASGAICSGAQIITTVDAFVAMTEQRPYCAPKTRPQAREELLRCSGSWFDPTIVAALVQILDEERHV